MRHPLWILGARTAAYAAWRPRLHKAARQGGGGKAAARARARACAGWVASRGHVDGGGVVRRWGVISLAASWPCHRVCVWPTVLVAWRRWPCGVVIGPGALGTDQELGTAPGAMMIKWWGGGGVRAGAVYG